MNYFKIQFICLLIIGSYVISTYAQNKLVQNDAATPSASSFAYPQSVFVDSHNGNIWVTDFDNNRVLRFDVSTLTSLDELQSLITPSDYFLEQNYPNPFNPVTIISWQSPVGSWQTLKVYDVLGNEIITLVDEYREAGRYGIEFNSSVIKNQPSSGIYFYQIKAGEFIQTKKMILIK